MVGGADGGSGHKWFHVIHPLHELVPRQLSLSVSVTLGLAHVGSTLVCVGFGGYANYLSFWMTMPVVFIGLLLLAFTYSLGGSTKDGSTQEDATTVPKRRAGWAPTRRPVLTWRPRSLRPSPKAQAFHLKLRDKAMPWVLWFLFLVYPSITNVAFDAFPCYGFRNPDLTVSKWIKADVSLECQSSEHSAIIRQAWVAIFTYPVGIFVGFGVLLFIARNPLFMKGKAVGITSKEETAAEEREARLYGSIAVLHRDCAHNARIRLSVPLHGDYPIVGC